MPTFKLFATIFISCCLPETLICQTIDKMFASTWADTWWTYIFKKDGTYQRVSNGEFGNTIVKGTYKLYNDTIELLTGYEKTHGTVNQLYILDKNGFLIDLWLRYDYAPIKNPNNTVIFPSRKREIKYPQTDTHDSSQKKILRQMILEIFNTDTIKKYFKLFPNGKQIYIWNYYSLNDTTQEVIAVLNHNIQFAPPGTFQTDFFIEIEDINMNPGEVNINLTLHKPDRTYIRVTFLYENGVWKLHLLYER